MASVTKKQLRVLGPYLEGDKPNTEGEIGLHCPFHNDKTRSASLNVETGLWYCQVCEKGGTVRNLVKELPDEEYGGDKSVASFIELDDEDEQETTGDPLDDRTAEEYHQELLGNNRAIKWLRQHRGLNLETAERFQVGFDRRQSVFTIPVRDRQGRLVNIRFYNPNPAADRRKIWGVTGHNEPRLYPMAALDSTELIICEGEWDAMLATQMGFDAITRTAAAKVWKSHWNSLFEDKCIYICQDRDLAGEEGAEKIMRALKPVAREIIKVELPYPVEEKHGKDITDYFHADGFTDTDFKELLASGEGHKRKSVVSDAELVDVGVLESFNASRVNQKLRMRVTITGKRSLTYTLPSDVDYSCTQSAGAKCQICPMNDMNGMATRHIGQHESIILEMMESSNKQIREILREYIGAQKCGLLEITPNTYRSVEELYVRPSVDNAFEANSGDHTVRKIVNVGSHDSIPNNTVEMVGTIYPSPRGQHNEFQAWDVVKTETSIDKFELTPAIKKRLKKFQPTAKQTPLSKIAEIAKDMSANVTKIYGRNEMHALMDLVFHSILSFDFGGQRIHRGWLEALIAGDTRTGKTEATERLIHYYRMGELVSCEAASFAGIVGGLQQFGNGKEWEITWGVVPINDRRLVALDEISGLTTEQIAQMSSIRSSGEAQLTKIKSEKTWARTRLLWLGNPRNGRMGDYTYGVQAIAPLIGNNEDIARFDVAMSLRADEVSPEIINSQSQEQVAHKYDQESCHELILWAWSRKPEHVKWVEAAEAHVYENAIALGERYTETPPLIQAANARIKVARLAVAIAARTYSTDDTGENVIVTPSHVDAAVKFIDKLYGMKGFGYKEISEEVIRDRHEAYQALDESKAYLTATRGLSKFLRSMAGSFRRQDLEDMLNLSREEATSIINALYKFKLIRRQGPSIKINPVLHDLLREIRE